MIVKTICRGLLDAVYPPICHLCGRLSNSRYPHCCQDCLQSFEPVGSSCCTLCGEPFAPDQVPHLCLACIGGRQPFGWCRGIYLYRGEAADALTQFKYHGQLPLRKPLVDTLVRGVEELDCLPDVELLVPVPLSKRGMWKRGYNQSFLLGSHLARYLGLPVYAEVLRRRGYRKQVGLSAGNRALNASQSYMPGGDIARISGRHILLFDDVYTTGATVRACAKILRGAGAEVSALTFARAVGSIFVDRLKQ